MGWLSDSLFGKKKRIDQNKINDWMQPYEGMIPEQEDIARGLMDPNSQLNRGMKTQMLQSQRDQMAKTQLGMQNQGAMMGMSPGQMMMQQRMQQNQQQGQFGQQYQGMLNSRWTQGLGQLQNVMGMKQGVGERLSNMHVQQVNASNAARQSRIGMAMGLAGTAMSAFGGGMGGSTPPT